MTQQKSRVLAPQGDWNSRLNILVWWLTTAYNSRSRAGDSMLSSGLIEHLHACVHTPQTYSVSQHACVYMPHTHPFSHMYMYSHTYIHRHTDKIFFKESLFNGICVCNFIWFCTSITWATHYILADWNFQGKLNLPFLKKKILRDGNF